MALIVGSARHDENGKYVNGKSGDQTGDEVSTQSFYVHKKGWYVIRPISTVHANAIAKKMLNACANSNIGYSQSGRYGIIKNGIDTKIKTNCDCSSLVRECVKEATGKDPGDFNTESEPNMLIKTQLFEPKKIYTNGMTLYNGDILVTKTKGHTVIVTSGNPRVEKANSTATSTNSSSSSSVKSVKIDPAKSFNKSFAKKYITTANLNMRAGASKQKKIITVIPKGKQVICYGYYTENWLLVSYNNKTGFCSKTYLQ